MHIKHFEKAKHIVDRLAYLNTRIEELREYPEVRVNWGNRSVHTTGDQLKTIANAVIVVLETEVNQLKRMANQISLILE